MEGESMFNAIKTVIAKCLAAVYLDYVADSIYEVPADQAKYIMGK